MQVWRYFWQFVDVVLVAILAAMILLVFSNVVLRYGFSAGLRQSVELSRLGLVWLVLIGSAVVLRRNEHIGLSEFSEAYFPRAVPVLRRLSYVVVLISMLMLLHGAYRQMSNNWDNVSQLTGLPTAVFQLAGVISAILMIVIALVRIVDPDALVDEDTHILKDEDVA